MFIGGPIRTNVQFGPFLVSDYSYRTDFLFISQLLANDERQIRQIQNKPLNVIGDYRADFR